MTDRPASVMARSDLPASGAGLRLRLVATSDLHAHLLPWDDLTDRAAPGTGLASVAGLIAQARAEEPNCLLLDNGDFLTGSPLAEHLSTRPEAGPNPVITAMNLLGYDAATLGNHEFSHGLGPLRRALRQAGFPVVSANVSRLGPGGARPFVPRVALLDREVRLSDGTASRLRIAVTGCLPQQTAAWEAHHLAGRVGIGPILPNLRRVLAGLRGAGADLVVVLAHTGLAGVPDRAGEEHLAEIILDLPGVDAVVAGHTHGLFPQAGQPAVLPMVMPGFNGSHLGVIDLDLAPDGAGGWRVTGRRAMLRAAARRDGQGRLRPLVKACPGVSRLVAPAHAAFRRHAATRVAETAVRLHSHFAFLGESPVDTLLAGVSVALVQGALTGTPHAGLPVLAAVAPFRCGGRGGPENYVDIPAGPLTLRHLADLYIHPNRLVALCLTGAEVAAWLERAASLFHRLDPERPDGALIRPDFPAYNFDMIHGLDYAVDLAAPARHEATGQLAPQGCGRIRDLRLHGRPLAPDDRVILATNSYRASGGAGFAGADAAHVVLEDPRHMRVLLQDHLARLGRVDPPPRAGWRLIAPAGTTAVFDTAPKADPALCSHALEPLGRQASGFMRFRLRF